MHRDTVVKPHRYCSASSEEQPRICRCREIVNTINRFCLEQFHAKLFSVLTDFEKARVERFKRATEEKLRDVRCPEHHQPPRLRFEGETLREIGITLSGCCGRLMDLANARIGSAWMDETSVKAS